LENKRKTTWPKVYEILAAYLKNFSIAESGKFAFYAKYKLRIQKACILSLLFWRS